MLGRAEWTARAPLLAIVTYLAAGRSAPPRPGWPADAGRSRDRPRRRAEQPDRSLRDRLQATYGTPGGATVAGLGLTLGALSPSGPRSPR